MEQLPSSRRLPCVRLFSCCLSQTSSHGVPSQSLSPKLPTSYTTAPSLSLALFEHLKEPQFSHRSGFCHHIRYLAHVFIHSQELLGCQALAAVCKHTHSLGESLRHSEVNTGWVSYVYLSRRVSQHRSSDFLKTSWKRFTFEKLHPASDLSFPFPSEWLVHSLRFIEHFCFSSSPPVCCSHHNDNSAVKKKNETNKQTNKSWNWHAVQARRSLGWNKSLLIAGSRVHARSSNELS